MNSFQALWWQQAASDHEIFVHLRGAGVAPCHALHYLQRVTEKIAKAYFWRSGTPPPKSHAGFVQFLRFLGSVPSRDRDRIATLFNFTRFIEFKTWIRTALPIAYELERVAPDLANNGANTEYPWPHQQPEFAPVGYDFLVWKQLGSSQGRHLMRFVENAVQRFPEYAET